MSFKLSKPDKFDTITSITIGVISIIIMAIIIISYNTNHYIAIKGESFRQSSTNSLYYVVVSETKNNDVKYEIETPSEIYAEQISKFVNKDLFFSKDGYVSYNDEKLPYRALN
jgi:hypothetical protein